MLNARGSCRLEGLCLWVEGEDSESEAWVEALDVEEVSDLWED